MKIIYDRDIRYIIKGLNDYLYEKYGYTVYIEYGCPYKEYNEIIIIDEYGKKFNYSEKLWLPIELEDLEDAIKNNILKNKLEIEEKEYFKTYQIYKN